MSVKTEKEQAYFRTYNPENDLTRVVEGSDTDMRLERDKISWNG